MKIKLLNQLSFTRRNLLGYAGVMLLTFAVFAVPAFGTTLRGGARRIHFRHGQTIVKIRGHLRGIDDEDLFVLRARKGQHMRVEIIGDGPTRGVVLFPSGGQDGGPGGVVFDDTLPDSGDYRIRVTESSMDEAWRGNFILKVEIQ